MSPRKGREESCAFLLRFECDDEFAIKTCSAMDLAYTVTFVERKK
jgi:hypothetical protein